MKIIIATTKTWNIKNAKKLQAKNKKINVVIVTTQIDLVRMVEKIQPKYIFFPHWSWFIPTKIHEKYKCILFHMTDLPYGRGGSPLQNLIIRGHEKTKISAIKVEKEIDSGAVYLKEDLELKGTAKNIYKEASRIIFDRMIPKLLESDISPSPQTGEVVIFERLKPENSKIEFDKLVNINQLYDKVRMLDAEGYPRAYFEINGFKLIFSKPKYTNNKLICEINIVEEKIE